MKPSELVGRRIVVTRATEDAERWADRLRRLGAHPVMLPCLEIVPIDDPGIATALTAALAGATWLVLSARRGVEEVARITQGALPRALHVAVVGPTTARASAEMLGRVDLVATESSARGLARALLARLDSDARDADRVIVAGAVNGRSDVERALSEAGIAVTRIDLYATEPVPPVAAKRDLGAEDVDIILLASPSAAEGLVNCALVPSQARVIAIGPTTTAAAAAVGLTISGEARRPDLVGLLEAIP